MTPHVLDSFALISYFHDEKPAREVQALLVESSEQDRPLLLSVVNWGEVVYVIEQRRGPEAADHAVGLMSRMHLEFVDVNQEQARLAASYKVRYQMSYADCFAAALAKLKKAELITGDKEFKEVEKEIKIHWL